MQTRHIYGSDDALPFCPSYFDKKDAEVISGLEQRDGHIGVAIMICNLDELVGKVKCIKCDGIFLTTISPTRFQSFKPFVTVCPHCECVLFGSWHQLLQPYDSYLLFPCKKRNVGPPQQKKSKKEPTKLTPKIQNLAQMAFDDYSLVKSCFIDCGLYMHEFLRKISHLHRLDDIWVDIFVNPVYHIGVVDYLFLFYLEEDYDHLKRHNWLTNQFYLENRNDIFASWFSKK